MKTNAFSRSYSIRKRCCHIQVLGPCLEIRFSPTYTRLYFIVTVGIWNIDPPTTDTVGNGRHSEGSLFNWVCCCGGWLFACSARAPFVVIHRLILPLTIPQAETILECSTTPVALQMATSEFPAPSCGSILQSDRNGTSYAVSIEDFNRD
ncbi:hypothetical protein GALMADRAFT_460228 [Galerina marginata CBS 339.88]|uniref:Uncharacterized protein n=1 Tax=Galerina marginata (strain CBS 339.88) TaxID=685588 RepID=A0A067TAR8_GALM3|nr:hypothetical protein GALMADRAFT_460228 [Galerina marginata CBS 339.88]